MPPFQGSVSSGVPHVAATMPAPQGYVSGEGPIFEYPYAISGTTKDSTGAALGSVTLALLRTADDSLVNHTVSDASGVYKTPASNLLQHYLVAYKVGSPDVAGTSVNTLVGS